MSHLEKGITMKIRNKMIQRIIIDLSCLLVFCLLLMIWLAADTVELKEQLQKTLKSGEWMIDYAATNNTAYAFISTSEDRKYGDRFLVFCKNEKGQWERRYENDFTGLKPWKLRLADIDGDGEQELLTAVRKTTHYDKEEKNRLFIFNYRENKLVKKWTGSDIAGSWENFVVGELVDAKGEEIIFITLTENEKEKLFVYHWFDFGFLLLAQSKDYEDITKVKIVGDNQIEISYRDGRKRREHLQLKDGRVIEVR